MGVVSRRVWGAIQTTPAMKILTPYFFARKYTKLSFGLSLLLTVTLTQAAHREMQQGDTLVFGLDPSWSTGSEFNKAFDGDVSTFYDYAYKTAESYVGFDHGVQAVPVEIHFTARKRFSARMVGGQFQGSNESATSGFETIYEVVTNPGEDSQVVELDTTNAYRYYRYLAPANSYGNIAEFEIVAVEMSAAQSLPAAPDGFRFGDVNGVTVFGLDPAWRSGREFEKAFDGDADTYYDYKYADRESFVGVDHGEAAVPTAINFAPRGKYPQRMITGRFEGSNESPYSGYELIYEITEKPVSGVQTVSLNTTNAYRYYRYLAPEGSYGAIAEFSIDVAVPGSESEEESASEEAAIEIEPVEEIEHTASAEPVAPVVETAPEPIVLEAPVVVEAPVNYPEGYRESVVGENVVFGLDPSWRDGREFENAFDGNPSTYYDYKYSDRVAFLGVDAGEAIVPEQIVFQARAKYSERMIGGLVQGSNENSVSGYETIYEISADPSESLQTIDLNTEKAYRYFRYVAPLNSYGNIAVFSVFAGESEEEEFAENTEDTEELEEEPVAPVSVPFASTANNDGQPGVLLSFNLEVGGLVSAAVYDLNGRMVRTLLEGAQLESGSHQVIWDGLNRDGQAVAAGQYTFKLLQGEGLTTEYVTSLGINPGTNDYDTWVGNHDGASSIAVDSTGMYVAAQITETAPVILKQSLDGSQRFWTKYRGDVTIERFQGGVALASDDNGKLFMLQQNGYLQVIDSDTGKLKSSWDVLPASETREMWNYLHDGDKVADVDMAAYASTLVLSFFRDDLLQWRDPSTGSVLTELSIDSPRGIAVLNSEEVLVASGDRVYRVSRSGDAQLVISAGLNHPERISIDRSNHTILVTDGYDDCQVKRFDFSGNLLNTHGRLGGRLDGNYVASDFREVSDIVSDGQGGFFVAEPLSGARRLAHFNAAGSVVKEWFGGQSYYAWAEPDPRDSSSVWYYTGSEMVLSELDLENKSWSVKETWDTAELANGLIKQNYGHRASWRVLYQGNQRYLVSESAPQVLAHSEGELRAVSITSNNDEQKERASELAGRANDFKAFRWLDANGDGQPQADEFTFTSHNHVPDGKTITDDFTLITSDRQTNALVVNRTHALWSTYGPYYPVGNEAGVNAVAVSAHTSIRAADRGTGSFMSSEGDYYSHYNLENEAHGVFWPTDWSGVSRFVKVDADGNEIWRVGRHAYHGGLAGSHGTTYIDTPAGQLHVPVKVIGEVGDSIVLADRVENPAIAWTKDGLYMGEFFDQRVDDGLPSLVYVFFIDEEGTPAITTSDNASGGRVIRYEDGTVLWFTQGRNSVPVYQVTGWDDFTRSEHSFELSTASVVAAANGSGLAVEYFTGELDHSSSVTGVETQVWNGVPRDGDGHDEVVDGRWGNVYDWTNGPELLNQDTDFTARWRGELEAPLSEDFTFSIYARGGVRLWINGYLIINSWNQSTERFESAPVRLVAGERYSVQLDYESAEVQSSLSLNWESRSLDRARIPSEFLYPVTSAPVYLPIIDASDYIEAASFDTDSGGMDEALVDAYSVRGYRQWGLGNSGSYLGYSDIDFGTGLSSILVEASGSASIERESFPVILEFRLGSPTGELLASVTLNAELSTYSLPIPSVSGVQDVYVVNATEEKWHHVDFRWFKFQ